MRKNGLQVAWWPIAKVKPYERNPRIIPDEAIEKVAASIKDFGWRQPIVVDRAGVIIAGHVRLLAAQRLRLTEVPVHVARLSKAKARAYRLADNRVGEIAGWDEQLLRLELADLGAFGLDPACIGFDAGADKRGAGEGAEKAGLGRLSERFGVPPFSVFNAREGWWQDRKRAWLSLGIRSELGRGGNLLEFSPMMQRGASSG